MSFTTAVVHEDKHVHEGGSNVQVMELTADSVLERQKHETMMIDLEAKQRAFQMDVPTLPTDVRDMLRSMGYPVRLFGENLAMIRDRLRMALARLTVMKEGTTEMSADNVDQPTMDIVDQTEETKYTRALPELIAAREIITNFSLQRARERLALERRRRAGAKRRRAKEEHLLDPQEEETPDEAHVKCLDDDCTKIYQSLSNMALEGSQYGDSRALSAVCTSHHPICGVPLICTASWNGTIHMWNADDLSLLGTRSMAHEDRIMNMALQPVPDFGDTQGIVATVSIDVSAKIWKITGNDTSSFQAIQVAHLQGHAARLSNVAFHPTGTYVGTTSFDHSWRLWDVATGASLLLQDGHSREVYGIGFHPDGGIVATTDFGGVIHNWDLRTGKTICHFVGHAKRVLCAEYAPNGFHLATAGDDGTIKIWDLRKRKQLASIPAHSNLISQLRFSHPSSNGEYLASSSFDGTAKLWSTRDWRMLSTLRGHEGKVMGIDVLRDGVVTSGYDKTLKLWK